MSLTQHFVSTVGSCCNPTITSETQRFLGCSTSILWVANINSQSKRVSESEQYCACQPVRVPFKSGNIVQLNSPVNPTPPAPLPRTVLGVLLDVSEINWTVAEYSNSQIILSFYAHLDILGTVINERFVIFLLRRSSSESEIEEIGTFSLSLRRTFNFKSK